MKRTICLVLAALLLVVSLAACGGSKLKGTYVSQGSSVVTYTFDGDTVVMSAFGIEIEGTYHIDGDEITFTYSYFGIEDSETESFSRSGDTITIDGLVFVKQ